MFSQAQAQAHVSLSHRVQAIEAEVNKLIESLNTLEEQRKNTLAKASVVITKASNC